MNSCVRENLAKTLCLSLYKRGGGEAIAPASPMAARCLLGRMSIPYLLLR